MSRELRTTLAIMAIVLIVSAPLIFADAPTAQTTNYLAMVFAYIPPTPTPTPTPTPKPIKLLINGDFEQGSDIGWTTNRALILHNTIAAHTGEWSGFLGSSSKDFQWIGQFVTVTADAPYLVYWSAVYSKERQCTYDSGYVHSIYVGSLDQVNEFCQSQQHEVYRKRVIDLRKWIGYTIDINFEMSTDSSILSVWDIDDVSMQAKP